AVFICPSYYLLNAFPGRSFKNIPAPHGDDLPCYIPTVLGAYLSHGNNRTHTHTSTPRCLSDIYGSPPPTVNNTAFATSFVQSFFNVARFMDPNHKFGKSNVTPPWPRFLLGNTEMLLNRIEGRRQDIRPVGTDSKPLQRCAYDVPCFLYGISLILLQFLCLDSGSVSHLTSQWFLRRSEGKLNNHLHVYRVESTLDRFTIINFVAYKAIPRLPRWMGYGHRRTPSSLSRAIPSFVTSRVSRPH
ncbi:hypothetical protein BDN71DRAFT_1382855, partial [Pleurotus eryngii]